MSCYFDHTSRKVPGLSYRHTRLSERVTIIALYRLTRCVAVLRATFPVTASCPLVYGRTLLSTRSAKVSSQLRMPQTNKSRNAPASNSSGSAQAEDVDPVAREESLAAGHGGGEDNVGDSDIIKSPSDPKQYR